MKKSNLSFSSETNSEDLMKTARLSSSDDPKDPDDSEDSEDLNEKFRNEFGDKTVDDAPPPQWCTVV